MPVAADVDALIDLIDEAAVVPDLWPDALDRIAAATGSVGRVILAPARNAKSISWRC